MVSFVERLLVHRRRKHRKSITAHKTQIATPVNLGTAAPAGDSSGFVLKANVQLAVAHSAGTAAGAYWLVIGNNRKLNVPALGANRIYSPGVIGERGWTIKVHNVNAPTGTVKVYIMDGNKAKQIASASIA